MAYPGVDWKNDPDHTSPINATNLEIMDNGIAEADANATAAKEEIEAVRVGADGVTYSSAKDAVNNQLNDVKAEIDYVLSTQEKLIKNIGVVSGTTYKTVSVPEIPAGTYKLKIESIVSSDTDNTKSSVIFYHNTTSVLAITDLPRNQVVERTVTFNNSITAINFYASVNANQSYQDTFTYSGVLIAKNAILDERIENIENGVYNYKDLSKCEYIGKMTFNTNVRASSTVIHDLKPGELYLLDVSGYTGTKLEYNFVTDSSSPIQFVNSGIGIDVSDDIAYLFMNESYKGLRLYRTGESYPSETVNIYKANMQSFVPYFSGMIPNQRYSKEVIPVEFRQGLWNNSMEIVSSANRLASTKLFEIMGKFKFSLTDYTTYRYGVTIFTQQADGTYRIFLSGWQTADFTVDVPENSKVAVGVGKINDSLLMYNENIGFKITPIGAYSKAFLYYDEINPQNDKYIPTVVERVNSGIYRQSIKPAIDHLFVGRTGSQIVIPHQSVYHVRLSRRFGYNLFEVNVALTSDGVQVVNHFASGKFGGYFHHVDGETDISDVAVNSVTWNWIVENVRYNSTIAKYRTRPSRLEEILAEMKQQGLLPLLQVVNDETIEIANKYLGKDNYIAYNGDRNNCPTAMISRWLSLTTKENILATCNSYGKPFAYSMANPTSFTDEQLSEIINELHKNGYLISAGYADTNWHKYLSMGFDMIGSITTINRLSDANLHVIDSTFGFSGYIVTNGTEENGILICENNGTIKPDIEEQTYDFCALEIEMTFDGSLKIDAIGEFPATTFTSNGERPVFLTIPIVNGSPKFTLTSVGQTEISELVYRATKV